MFALRAPLLSFAPVRGSHQASGRLGSTSLLLVCLAAAGASTASAQPAMQVATRDGSASATLGVLAQGSAAVDTADGLNSTTDLCFRRLRFIAGGKVAKKIKFFVETDTPYLGRRASADWSVPATFIQDFIVTAEIRDEFQIDAGWLMVPVSYNSTQSAASLMAVAYSPYSFLSSAPTKSRVGRDEGVQARGYLWHKHVEYRAGTFLGASKRDDVPMRYAARAVWYPFGAQTGFFYAGTMHGQRKVLGIGASIDAEGSYRARAVDVFAEFPLPNRQVVTMQADYIHYDGGRTFAALAPQDTWMLEGGYRFGRSQFGAYGQFARDDLRAATAADAAAVQAGAVYWVKGNRLNVKAGVGRTMKDRAASHTQFVSQVQVFVF